MTLAITFLGLFLIIILTVAILSVTGVIKWSKKKNENSTTVKSTKIPAKIAQKRPKIVKEIVQEIKDGKSSEYVRENYIQPTEFGCGLIHMDSPGDYKISDLCGDHRLYPVQALDVDYGFKMPEYCQCMQFIQPP